VAEEGNDKQGGPKALPSSEPAGYFEGESMTRRTAFTIGVQAVGGLAGAAIVLPAIGFAAAPLFEEEEEPWQAVGATTEFSPDTYRPVVITAVEGIGETGKTTAYVRKGNPSVTANQTKYPPESPDEFIAISTRCAHVGCPVRFVQASRRFICPCHGGVYDFTGSVSGGPPVRPLDHFYTRLHEGQVEIGPRYSVNSEFERFPAYRDPGQDLDGIGQYLYPGRFSTPKLD
jgi:menaquinol-cytochrome c reductase iron-sulfur subunit